MTTPRTLACPRCAAAAAPGSRFCSTCGSELPPDPESATELAPAGATPSRPLASRPPSGLTLEGARFAPGTLLGGRYRIVGLLGKGGMGEVYRAEDLLLEQPVALKLLPVELAADPDRVSRLLTEVRLARQVSHPNVCRVWDVGEADGHRFLTMELIEGEDLAALLRQVGRIPGERGVDIARQLCAGLAAAHERGVVHRDLKPANVLVDRSGRVHVTDFGLALAGAAEGLEAFAGTPGYMAPEQLAGRAATARSDLYALGVVLYELFTGQRPYRAASLDELRRRIAEEAPRPPSEVVPDLDPALERVILRCLERDPEARPLSALAVAGALPGADPLAAALAAGETPSPEMVAAAGGEGGMEPRAALALAAVAAAAVVLAAVAASFSHIVRFSPLDKPPSYLVERSRELLAELGHTAPPNDDGHSWPWNEGAIDWLRRSGRGDATWRPLATGRIPGQTFVYRQSPREFRPATGFAVLAWGEPPLHVPGEARVELDARGRLIGVAVVPPAYETAATAPAPPPRWDRLFAAAGLDGKTFRPVPVEWTPPMAVDARAAWVGEASDLPGVPLRLEAAAWRGRLVWLHTVGPWARPPTAVAEALSPGERLEEGIAVSLAAGSLLVAMVLAYRHLRTGRGDRRGAWRLAFWFFVAHTLVWAGTAEHARSAQQEWSLVQRDLGYNLFLAALLWLYYVGLEPYVRRQWPEMLISWNRLLAGRMRDPRVGRDVLIGLGAGAVVVTLDWLGEALPAWRRGEPPPPRYPLAKDFVLDALDNFVHGLLDAMLIVFILLLILVVVRRRWLAAVLGGSLFTALLVLGDESPFWSLGPSALAAAVGLWVMVRFGLVAFALMLVVADLVAQTPWSAHAGAWYAWQSWTMGALLASMLLFGLRTVTAGRPLFAGGVLADAAR